MEEQTKDTPVKSVLDLWKVVNASSLSLDDAMNAYCASRLPTATDEERFNEGRYGRHALEIIDSLTGTLTQLRMRINLQQEGRDSARAKQLDRILGISETMAELDEVDRMIEIVQRDEGGGTS